MSRRREHGRENHKYRIIATMSTLSPPKTFLAETNIPNPGSMLSGRVSQQNRSNERYRRHLISTKEEFPRHVVLRASQEDMSTALSFECDGMFPELIETTQVDSIDYCVTEFIDGVSLREYLHEPLSPGQAVTVLVPIARAFAHLRRIGFRLAAFDLDDVVIGKNGQPRITGLGSLVKLADNEPRGPRRRYAPTQSLPSPQLVEHATLMTFLEEVQERVVPEGALESVLRLGDERMAAVMFHPFEDEIERELFACARPKSLGADGAHLGSQWRREGSPGRRPGYKNLEGRVQPKGRVDAKPSRIVVKRTDYGSFNIFSAIKRMSRRRHKMLILSGFLGAAVLVLLLTLIPPKSSRSSTMPASIPSELEAGVQMKPNSTEANTTSSDLASNGPRMKANFSADEDGSLGIESTLSPEDEAIVATRALLTQREHCLMSRDISCLSEIELSGSGIATKDRSLLNSVQDKARQAPATPGADADKSVDPVIVNGDGLGFAGEAWTLDKILMLTAMGDAALLAVPYRLGADEGSTANVLIMRDGSRWKLRDIWR